MVVRISDKTQNYSKVTKLLVKPLNLKTFIILISLLSLRQIALTSSEQQFFHRTLPNSQIAIIFDLNVDHNPDRTLIK